MTREELKEQIDELMRQYADEEIDGGYVCTKDDGINCICSGRRRLRVIVDKRL